MFPTLSPKGTKRWSTNPKKSTSSSATSKTNVPQLSDLSLDGLSLSPIHHFTSVESFLNRKDDSESHYEIKIDSASFPQYEKCSQPSPPPPTTSSSPTPLKYRNEETITKLQKAMFSKSRRANMENGRNYEGLFYDMLVQLDIIGKTMTAFKGGEATVCAEARNTKHTRKRLPMEDKRKSKLRRTRRRR